MHRRSFTQALVLGVFPALAPRTTRAGEFAVQPSRLTLTGAQASGAFVLVNESAGPLSFQIKGMRWDQDEDGREHYHEAPELVYFPRLLTLAAGRSSVIRVGLRGSASDREQTFRLFMEELPPPDASGEGGARIRVLVRFGAPVFWRPLRVRHQLSLAGLRVEHGQARWSVRNEGNVHEVFRAVSLRGIDAAGGEVFRQALLAERYLLAGATRHFQAALPCGAGDSPAPLARLSLTLQTEQSELRRDLEVVAPPCA